MKILIITKNYYPEKTVVSKIAEGLFKRGHNVTVLTAKPSFGLGYILPGYQNISYELYNGVKVHRVDVSPRRKSRFSLAKNDFYFYKNTRKWVRKTKEKYDVVYSYGYSPATDLSAGNLYKKKHKTPHIAHIIKASPDDNVYKQYIFKYTPIYFALFFISRHIYRKPDELIISSPVYEEYIKKALRIKKANTTFIPSLPLFEEGAINPYPYKDGFHIVSYGDIDKSHILYLLPQAMEKISRKDIYFHLVGKGKLAKDLLDEINRHNLGDHIILHGDKPLEDVQNYFTNADAIYLSLSNKGYSGKAIDEKLIFAMSQKKPIIAVMDGDGAEVLKESEGGFLLKENVDDLVYTISRAASTSKEELLKKGTRNYEYFLKHYSLMNIIADIESVLLKKCL